MDISEVSDAVRQRSCRLNFLTRTRQRARSLFIKRTATIGADVAAPVADLGLEAGEAGEAGEAVLDLGLDMVPYKHET